MNENANINGPGAKDNAKKDPFNRAAKRGKIENENAAENGGGSSEFSQTETPCGDKNEGRGSINFADAGVYIERKDIDDAVGEGLVIKEFAPGLWNFLLARGRSSGRCRQAQDAQNVAAEPFNDQTDGERFYGAARPGGGVSHPGGTAETSTGKRSNFTIENVIYFFGGLMIIAAMTFFVGMTFEQLGGPGITLVSALYIAAFVVAGRTLYFDHGYEIPGGLLITIAVCITPLLIYGLEVMFDFWPEGTRPGSYHEYHVWVKASWIFMEIGTIAAGALALRFFKFPFLTMPIAFSSWYLSMDLTPFLFGSDTFHWEERLWVSCFSGIIMIIVAYHYDRRTKKDYSFWLYMFGVMAFWGGLSFMKGGGEFGKFVYCLINIAMIFISVIIQRKVFIVFGGLGVFGYLGYLSSSVFKDFIGFTFVLTLLGLAVIGAGMFYSKNREYFETIPERIPDGLKKYLPQYRDAIK